MIYFIQKDELVAIVSTRGRYSLNVYSGNQKMITNMIIYTIQCGQFFLYSSQFRNLFNSNLRFVGPHFTLSKIFYRATILFFSKYYNKNKISLHKSQVEVYTIQINASKLNTLYIKSFFVKANTI